VTLEVGASGVALPNRGGLEDLADGVTGCGLTSEEIGEKNYMGRVNS